MPKIPSFVVMCRDSERKGRLQVGQDFCFSGFWRQTFVRSCVPGQAAYEARREVRVGPLYSDVLYSSWHWARARLRSEWLAADSIPRVAASDLSRQRFVDEFEKPNRPVIITGLVRNAARAVSFATEGCLVLGLLTWF